MLDIKLIRENPEIVKENLLKREWDTSMVDEVLKYDALWRKLVKEVNLLRERRNKTSLEIRDLKAHEKDASTLIKEMRKISDRIKENEEELSKAKEKRDELLMRIPNLMHPSVPKGKDESENVPIRSWGVKRQFNFKPRSHVDLISELNLADILRASKVSGSRFYYLKNQLVRLDLALQCFALDFLEKKGFEIMEPPLMMKRKPYEGVTDLSDFEDVMYKIEDEDLYLIATSEHALAPLYMGEILDFEDLPLRYAGLSPCFRKEAGAHGKDTKGIFRVHIFNKVEQFVFSAPESSWGEHEFLIRNAEEIYQKLELPYRVVNICTGDLGTVASKKYDLEVWMPVQKTFREVVSCSNCTDYQARRLRIRYREKMGENRFVHTLNSTAIATPRTMVAILENFQREDGTVSIPKVLRKYLDFERIEFKK